MFSLQIDNILDKSKFKFVQKNTTFSGRSLVALKHSKMSTEAVHKSTYKNNAGTYPKIFPYL